MAQRLVGSEMCLRDRNQAQRTRGQSLDDGFNGEAADDRQIEKDEAEQVAVSYTHMTLPTILLVSISVVAVSLKKKKKTNTSNTIITIPTTLLTIPSASSS